MYLWIYLQLVSQFRQGNSKKQIWNYLVGKLICRKEPTAVINMKSWNHLPRGSQRGTSYTTRNSVGFDCLTKHAHNGKYMSRLPSYVKNTNILLRRFFWKDWRYLQQSFVGHRLLWMIAADIYKTSGRCHPVELNRHVILTAGLGVMFYSWRTGFSKWHFITHKPWYQEKVYLKF